MLDGHMSIPPKNEFKTFERNYKINMLEVLRDRIGKV